MTPDAATLVSGETHGAIRFWSVDERRVLGAVACAAGVKSLAVTPEHVFALDEKGTVRRWSLEDRKELPLAEAVSDAAAMVHGVDGRVLVIARGSELALLDVRTGRRLTTLRHAGRIDALAAPVDGRFVAAAVGDGKVIVWDLAKWWFQGRCAAGYLLDRDQIEPEVQAAAYEETIYGETVTFTLSCGAPTPAGTTCTCNCVAGTKQPVRWDVPLFPQQFPGGGGGSYCTCNKVCTCVPISSRRWKKNIAPLEAALNALAMTDSADVRLTAMLVEAMKSQQRQLARLQRSIAAAR